MHRIVVNSSTEETRVAVLEGGTLVELFVERETERRMVGNIYRGTVENVLPGMQAAFVDIGMDRNAFLFVADAVPKEFMEDGHGPGKKEASIRDLVKKGQEVLVQVTKEPLGTKGPRVTSNLTLPGRHLVLMPTFDYVGVSRRIADEGERARLRSIANAVKPDGMGIIARTAAEGGTEEDFASDVAFLVKLWDRIQAKIRKGNVPSLIYRDHDLIYRILRDYMGPETEELVLDDPGEYAKAVENTRIFSPGMESRVKLHPPGIPVFEAQGIEPQVEKTLRRKLWLDCGGYIVIDQTEALTAIDVNTGKFTGSVDLEDTVVKTNLEAAGEIARQLRLRDIGGIIIIDFIDMDSDAHRREVLRTLEEAMAADRTKSSVLGFTSLGLVEMTRKKARRPLEETLMVACPYCDGRGKVMHGGSIAEKVRREIGKWADRSTDEALLVKVHPSVAAVLIGNGGKSLEKLEQRLGRTIFVRGDESMHTGEYAFPAMGSREQVQAKALPVSLGQVVEVVVDARHLTRPSDGIGRLDGFVLDVEGAGDKVGETVNARVDRIHRTFAKAVMVGADGSD